jgi:hypothetical protein
VRRGKAAAKALRVAVARSARRERLCAFSRHAAQAVRAGIGRARLAGCRSGACRAPGAVAVLSTRAFARHVAGAAGRGARAALVVPAESGALRVMPIFVLAHEHGERVHRGPASLPIGLRRRAAARLGRSNAEAVLPLQAFEGRATDFAALAAAVEQILAFSRHRWLVRADPIATRKDSALRGGAGRDCLRVQRHRASPKRGGERCDALREPQPRRRLRRTARGATIGGHGVERVAELLRERHCLACEGGIDGLHFFVASIGERRVGGLGWRGLAAGKR